MRLESLKDRTCRLPRRHTQHMLTCTENLRTHRSQRASLASTSLSPPRMASVNASTRSVTSQGVRHCARHLCRVILAIQLVQHELEPYSTSWILLYFTTRGNVGLRWG